MVVSQFKITHKLYKVETCTSKEDTTKLIHTFLPAYSIREDNELYIPRLLLSIASNTCFKLLDENNKVLGVISYIIKGHTADMVFIGINKKLNKLAVVPFFYATIKDTTIKSMVIKDHDNVIYFSSFSKRYTNKAIIDVPKVKEYSIKAINNLSKVVEWLQ